ncbi:hypothetical protein KQI86_10080 [Clostridium sp. MSJ-11]|uniref:Uncharacterized protein n=1 Tax=Clostridium mobile TaxID=2841512 RepID=A0ABS6EHI1_9CLOT|nr:hypothetical protein [Clostridium mobile]MBU5484680.1 hypothetical protein [Clostridium mobile]
MGYINDISPQELATLANIVAIALTEGRTADESNVLGNFIATVGALILTIAAQQQSLEARLAAKEAKDTKDKDMKDTKTSKDKKDKKDKKGVKDAKDTKTKENE